MRKLSALIFLFALATGVYAQNEDHKITLGLNTGFSLIGNIIDASASTSGGSIENFSLPAFQGTVDYGVEKWISVGVAVSYQKLGTRYTDYNGTNIDEETTANRLNFAIRPLFHYANSGRLDLYSGVRLGWTNWSFKTTIDDQDYNEEDIISANSNFAPQLILFGMRGFITENIGANFEFAVGAPHYFTIGLSYRL